VSSSAIVITLGGGVTVTLPAGTEPHTVRAHVTALADGLPATTGQQRANSPYMTAEEAATYLRFPKKRIYGLTSRGEIPHRKQDGRLVFRRDELDRWMDEFYVGPDWAGPADREVL
jgi:excisionase family DNA binding protein